MRKKPFIYIIIMCFENLKENKQSLSSKSSCFLGKPKQQKNRILRHKEQNEEKLAFRELKTLPRSASSGLLTLPNPAVTRQQTSLFQNTTKIMIHPF